MRRQEICNKSKESLHRYIVRMEAEFDDLARRLLKAELSGHMSQSFLRKELEEFRRRMERELYRWYGISPRDSNVLNSVKRPVETQVSKILPPKKIPKPKIPRPNPEPKNMNSPASQAEIATLIMLYQKGSGQNRKKK